MLTFSTDRIFEWFLGHCSYSPAPMEGLQLISLEYTEYIHIKCLSSLSQGPGLPALVRTWELLYYKSSYAMNKQS